MIAEPKRRLSDLVEMKLSCPRCCVTLSAVFFEFLDAVNMQMPLIRKRILKSGYLALY